VFNPGADSELVKGRMREREAVARRRASREKGIAEALEGSPLFSLCSKRELRLVAKLAKAKELRPGTTLVTEGETGDSMFVILSGGANVHKGGRKIAELGSGDVVGELALLSKAPRNATVTTRTNAEVAVLGRRELFRLIEDAPGFSRKLLEALANRVRELDRKAYC
jgi:CRP-like cAMP-binding protein